MALVSQEAFKLRDGQRILVVDDEQYVCEVCARALHRAGYDVVATTSSNEVLQLLRNSHPFDLLLTDIKMPAISGLELARQAREIDPAIAIIIMTGHASIDHLQQAVQRGAADFLAKPFEIEQLRLAVEQALHKRALAQDNIRLRAVERLLRSSEAINGTLDHRQLITITIDAVVQHTHCRGGFLILNTGPDEPYQLIATPGAALLSGGQLLCDQTRSQCQSVTADGTTPIAVLDGEVLHHGTSMPLRAQGQLVGVVLVCDTRPLPAVAQEALALLANQAGTALHNAALYSQLQDAYQRQQELDRLKSEFISIASHELRTPLSIVIGYTMMMRDQAEGERREYLQRVLDNAQRIKDIVDDMVSLRHLETGQTYLTFERVVMQDLIRQAAEQMRPMTLARQQSLELELPASPLICDTDREKILLILANLISNAIKFTPASGHVQISAYAHCGALPRHSHPARHANQDWVVVAVHDDGIGISPREQTRIFDRFYQVAESLTRDHGGTGLGLAVVRELMTVLGGAVWVDSVQGQGSTFSFAIPCTNEDFQSHTETGKAQEP